MQLNSKIRCKNVLSPNEILSLFFKKPGILVDIKKIQPEIIIILYDII